MRRASPREQAAIGSAKIRESATRAFHQADTGMREEKLRRVVRVGLANGIRGNNGPKSAFADCFHVFAWIRSFDAS
jgi:hypothetical protein